MWCSLSLSLYDSMMFFLFRIPHFETPTRNQNWSLSNLCLCKFIQTFSNFRQSWPKTCGVHGTSRIRTQRSPAEMCNLFRIDVEWPSQVATSAAIPPLAYLIFIGTVTVLFVAMQLLHLIEFIPIFGGFYFIFLTNWTLLLETLTMVMLFASTLWGYLTPPGEGQKAPLFVRYTVSLWYIIQPMSLIVTILYWTLVNQFWDPYEIHFTSLWAHLLNWMVLIVALFLTRIPWRLSCT